MMSTSDVGLLDLPEPCVSVIICALLKDGGNPGDVARLSMVSKFILLEISQSSITFC
jgi:hypothetical protein